MGGRWRRRTLWLAGAAVAVVVLAVGGTFVYFHVISGPTPAPLRLKSAASPAPSASGTASPGAASLAGTWNTSHGSVVGYRVQEVLFGQNHPPSAGAGRSPATSRSAGPQ